MFNGQRNSIEFRVWGRYAMFTNPITRVGGEKCSYHVPTYEAIKGIVKSIYWKPTLIWVVDRVRVMKQVRTQTKGTKPLDYIKGGNTLAIYSFLTGDADAHGGLPSVEYQVQAHFEWNMFRSELEGDRNEGKHFESAKRSLDHGGRQDIFLGTRDCQGYVEPCVFGSGAGDYDDVPEISYGLMFHSFGYPDETGKQKLISNFWRPTMRKGIIHYPRPEACDVRKDVRAMGVKPFGIGLNLRPVEGELKELESGDSR